MAYLCLSKLLKLGGLKHIFLDFLEVPTLLFPIVISCRKGLPGFNSGIVVNLWQLRHELNAEGIGLHTLLAICRLDKRLKLREFVGSLVGEFCLECDSIMIVWIARARKVLVIKVPPESLFPESCKQSNEAKALHLLAHHQHKQ
eukprot:724188-Pleurochrysis_carterae.AAC.1